jgi:hypothetical protein
MPETLAVRLHDLHVEHLIRIAETIRDWPATKERLDQATRYIRETMYFCAMKRISQAEESQVFSILSFAMPTRAAVENEPIPDKILDQTAADEAAYNEQIERRSCPECGDGMCPTGE